MNQTALLRLIPCRPHLIHLSVIPVTNVEVCNLFRLVKPFQ